MKKIILLTLCFVGHGYGADGAVCLQGPESKEIASKQSSVFSAEEAPMAIALLAQCIPEEDIPKINMLNCIELIHAILEQNFSQIESFLTEKPNLLALAVKLRVPKVVTWLLKRGTNPNVKTLYGESPLHIATEMNDIISLAHLLHHKANPNILNLQNATALHVATLFNRTEIAELLITYNADPNALTHTKGTPLHFAARNNNDRIIKSLLEENARLDMQNIYGKTPLHIAGESHNYKTFDYLITSGADETILDNAGLTARQYLKIQPTIHLPVTTLVPLPSPQFQNLQSGHDADQLDTDSI